MNILEENEWQSLSGFDFIVSNPPYIPTNEYEKLEREVLEFEPRLALTDEANGLLFYKRIIELAKEKLNSGGFLFFELGYNQGNAVAALISAAGCFEAIKQIPDLSGLDRIVFAKKLEINSIT